MKKCPKSCSCHAKWSSYPPWISFAAKQKVHASAWEVSAKPFRARFPSKTEGGGTFALQGSPKKINTYAQTLEEPQVWTHCLGSKWQIWLLAYSKGFLSEVGIGWSLIAPRFISPQFVLSLRQWPQDPASLITVDFGKQDLFASTYTLDESTQAISKHPSCPPPRPMYWENELVKMDRKH